jgi:hypothetical protein
MNKGILAAPWDIRVDRKASGLEVEIKATATLAQISSKMIEVPVRDFHE